MTTQVRRLETMGLITRASDPRDGRAILVRSTRGGAARHQSTKATARAVYKKLLAVPAEDDLRQAARVAAGLVQTLEQRQAHLSSG
jgi:DNA-binding MarR family transcriptional regulator